MVNQDGFGDFESGGAEVAVKFHKISNFKFQVTRKSSCADGRWMRVGTGFASFFATGRRRCWS